jgi:hypothetical protein
MYYYQRQLQVRFHRNARCSISFNLTLTLTLTPTLQLSHSADYDLTGQVLWPASKVLCDHILSQPPSTFANQLCLELGAGVGVCGLVLSAHSTPLHNVLSDGNEVVMEILHTNVDRFRTAHADRAQQISSTKLTWGSPAELDALLQRFPQRFDFIYGSDIVAWDQWFPDLVTLLRRLLSRDRSNSHFLLCFQSRSLTKERYLWSLLNEAELEATEIERDNAREDHIHLYRIAFRK